METTTPNATPDVTELKTYVVVCAGVERFRHTPEEAREQASVLSAALCPQVAEVIDTRVHESVAVFVDGTEYHPSLGDLARSPEAFVHGYEAARLAAEPIRL